MWKSSPMPHLNAVFLPAKSTLAQRLRLHLRGPLSNKNRQLADPELPAKKVAGPTGFASNICHMSGRVARDRPPACLGRMPTPFFQELGRLGHLWIGLRP